MDALQNHTNLIGTAVAGVREAVLQQVETARPESELTIIEGHGR